MQAQLIYPGHKKVQLPQYQGKPINLTIIFVIEARFLYLFKTL